MVKKIYNMILVLLFALPVTVFAPDAFGENKGLRDAEREGLPYIMLEHVQAGELGPVQVPLYFYNFSDLGSAEIRIWYDQNILGFTGFTENEDSGLSGNWEIAITDHNEITLMFIGEQTAESLQGHILDLEFDYLDGFTSQLKFKPGYEFKKSNLSPIFVNLAINGSVSPDITSVDGITALGQNVKAMVGQEVAVPITMSGNGYASVGAISLKIEFDPVHLQFVRVDAGEVDGFDDNVTVTNGLIEIEWINLDGENLVEETVAGYVVFKYKGGITPITFLQGSEINTTGLKTLFTYYQDGSVVPDPDDVALQAIIDTKEAVAGDEVQIDITVGNVPEDGVIAGSADFFITYDTDKLDFLGTFQDGILANWNVVETADGLIELKWFNPEGVELTNEVLISLNFGYNGGGMANILFDVPPAMTTPFLVPIQTSGINGGVIEAIGDRVITIGRIISFLDACDTQQIHVPVHAAGLEEFNISAIDMQMMPDNPGVLTFVGFANVSETLTAAGSVQMGDDNRFYWIVDGIGSVNIEDGKLFDIVYTYNGGETDINVLVGQSEVLLSTLAILPVSFVGGGVSELIVDVEVDAVYDEIRTITSTPVIVPFDVHYGNLATINPDILVDARITADGGFPAGTTIQKITYNGHVVPVVNGEIGGLEQVLLSHILGTAPTSLAGHDNRVDEWVMTIDGVEDTGDTHINVKSLATLNECTQILGEGHLVVGFEDAALTIGEIEPVCYDETNEITVTITYPEIVNLDESIKADALLAIDPAINAGATLEWSYNSQAGGEYVFAEETENIKLSEIVGSQAPLAGHSEKTDVWTISLSDVTAGEYIFAVHALAQLDSEYYIYEAETSEFEIFAEPAIGFTFGDHGLAGEDDTFSYCYNEPVSVTLSHIWSGTAPFNIEWEVFVDGSETADPLLSGGETGVGLDGELFAELLAPGEYVVKITYIEDANGCEPADYGPYVANVIVNEEPIVGFTFKDLADTGTEFTYCFNESVSATLSHVYAGQEPFHIEWEVFVNGSELADTDLSGYKDDVYAGDELFDDILPAAEYVIKIVKIIDDNGCEPSNYAPYTANVIVFEEPMVQFAINGDPIGEGHIENVVYGEDVAVTFHNKLAGEFPFVISWVVNDDPEHELSQSNVEITEAGQLLFSADDYPLHVGPYDIKITYLMDGNMCEAEDLDIYQASVVVAPKPLTITAIADSKVYGEDDPLVFEYTAGDLAYDDVFVGELEREEGENVGTYTITLGTLTIEDGEGNNVAGNYDITYVPADFTITPATLEVVADEGQSKVYGEDDPIFTYTAEGFQFDDDMEILEGELAREEGEHVGMYAITLGTLTAGDNYVIDFTPADFEILPLGITITAIADSKVYGQDDPLVFEYTADDLAFDDVFVGELVREEGEDAGAYEILIGTLTIEDGEGNNVADNYDITYVPADFTITPATLDVVADEGQSKIYGEDDPVFTYTATGFQFDDDLDILEGELSREPGEDVGMYAITLGTLTAGDNYVIDFTTADFEILIKEITIVGGFTAFDKVYDGTTDAEINLNNLILDGAIEGDDVYLTDIVVEFEDPNAGEDIPVHLISAELAGEAASNYLLVMDADNGSEGGKGNVVFDFGDNNAMFIHPIEAVAGAIVTVEVEIHNVEDFVGFNLEIPLPAGFSVAEDTEHLFRYTDHMLLFNVDHEDGVDVVKIIAFSPTNAPFLGTEGVIVSFELMTAPQADDFVLEIGNATMGDATEENILDEENVIAGTLTLAPLVGLPSTTADIFHKELTIGGDFTALNKVYDGTVDAEIDEDNLELIGVVEGEDVELANVVVEFAAANAGEDILVSIVDADIVGADIINYTLSIEGAPTANADITPAPLAVVADEGQGKVYGEEDPLPFTYEVTGFINGDDESLISGALDRVAGEDVGLYAITVGTLEAGNNYEIVFASADFEITPATIEVAADEGQSKIYGDNDPVFTFTATGFQWDDDYDVFTGALSREEGEAVGSYPITLGTLSAGINYEVDFTSADFEILQKVLLISGSFTAFDKEYDSTTAAQIDDDDIILLGVVEGDDVYLVDVVVEFDDPNVGTDIPVRIVSVDIAGDDADNYYLLDIEERMALVDQNGMMIHDVTVEAGGVVTIQIEIVNTEDFVGFSVDVPIPDGFTYVDGSADLFRITDHEFMFNVTEANVAKIIAYSTENEAFTGNDGVVFSFDLHVPEILGDYAFELVDAVVGNADEEDILDYVQPGTVTIVDEIEMQNIMIVNDIVADPGEIVTIEIEIVNSHGFIGFNADIPLPAGFTYVEGTAQLHRDVDHVSFFNIDETHTAKVIAYSLTSTDFLGNQGLIFSFDVQLPDDLEGLFPLHIVNAVMGNAEGDDILTDTESGSIAIGEIPLFPSTTASIFHKELTIGGTFTALDKVYDGTVDAEIDTHDLELIGVIGDEDVSLANVVVEFAQAGVGEDIVVSIVDAELDGEDISNYLLSIDGAPTANADITPAALAVIADDATKVYGEADPEFTFTAEGFIIGEDESILTGELSREEGETVGTYVINLGTLSAGANYAIDFTHAELVITHRELTIGGSFTALDKVFDGTVDAEIDEDNLVLVNVVAGDAVALTDVVVEFASPDIGFDIPVHIVNAALAGADQANYILSLVGAPSTTADIFDEIEEPFNLAVYTEGFDYGSALFTWNDGTHQFRYDTGVVTGQLGFQGDLNSVLGSAYHYDAEIREVIWWVTSEEGEHDKPVKIWILGLDEFGRPDRHNILYENANVPTHDNMWSRYVLDTPVHAPNGFYIGLSYDGYLSLAVDDGTGFQDETQWTIFNIATDEVFRPLEADGKEHNFLLRAYGTKNGTVEHKTAEQIGASPVPPVFIAVDTPFEVDDVLTDNYTKAFLGFDVFLDGELVAEGIAATDYLFTNLDVGTHTAGVRSVYTSGTSDIITINFEIPSRTFRVSFNVMDATGLPIENATVTLDGMENETGDYSFDGILAGTYNYSVVKLGYFTVDGSVTVDNQSVTVDVTLVIDDTSIEEPELSLHLYPNPVNSVLTVEANTNITSVRMIDMLGKVVYNATMMTDHHEIDVRGFINGIYFVQITTAQGVHTHRVQVTD